MVTQDIKKPDNSTFCLQSLFSFVGKFCGKSVPDPVESTSNIMQIIFSSDSRANYIGFRAKISFHGDQCKTFNTVVNIVDPFL